MIRALQADLRQIAGVTLVQLPPAGGGGADVMVRFERALDDCDAAWPIAPETRGCLEQLSRQVLARVRVLLNSLPEAVRVAGSKWLTWKALTAADVASIPTFRHLAEVSARHSRVVAKPDDGAGCEETFLLRAGETPGRLPANPVFQPWVEGAARSFSMLCTDHGAELLCRNTQHIVVRDQMLHFDGVDIAIDDGDVCGGGRHHVIAALARRVHAALPGLRGFVGVDYIDSVEGPVVVEINPRLTSAYVGLSARLHRNLAGEVLQTLTGTSAGRSLTGTGSSGVLTGASSSGALTGTSAGEALSVTGAGGAT